MTLSAFFVLISTCQWSCQQVIIEFDYPEACVQFVTVVGKYQQATCFERKTGKLIYDSKGRTN